MDRRLAYILGAALGVRVLLLGAAWHSPEGRLFTPDSPYYQELSDSLAATGTFANRHGEAETFRTPGYPVFLLIGRPFGASAWRATAVAQLLIDVGLVGLTWLLGVRLAGPRAGLWAAAFQAVTPVAVAAGLRMLSDGLYAFLLTAAVLLLLKHFRTSRRLPLAGAAGAMGLACYVRPVAMVMAALMVLVLLCRRRGLGRAAAFAGVFAACVAPWISRNWSAVRYPGFSDYASGAMYFFAVPEIISRTEGIDPLQARRRMADEAQAWRRDHPEAAPGEAAVHRRRRAIQVIRAHAGLYAKLHLVGSLGFWLPGATDVLEILGVTTGGRGTIDVIHTRGLAAGVRHYFGGNAAAAALAAPLALIPAIEYLGALCCAAAGLRRRRFALGAGAWLAVAMVAAAALLPGPFGLPRYRVPVAPILNVAAAAGWLALVAQLRRARPGDGPPAAADRPTASSRQAG